MKGAQLTLGVRLRDDARFGNYLGERNGESAVRLRALSGDRTLPLIVLCGDSGTGKSHLLQAVCHAVEARGESALCLDMRELLEAGAGVLEGLSDARTLCLDNLEVIFGDPDWEEAVFHLFNRMGDEGHQLVVSLTEPPSAHPPVLSDLASRLGHGVILQLGLPRDEDRLRILGDRAAERGLELPDDVSRYILRRASRHTGELLSILEQLDEGSLREQRRLTIPFVKQTLGWNPTVATDTTDTDST